MLQQISLFHTTSTTYQLKSGYKEVWKRPLISDRLGGEFDFGKVPWMQFLSISIQNNYHGAKLSSPFAYPNLISHNFHPLPKFCRQLVNMTESDVLARSSSLL